jgi:hypothetical protein
LIYAINKTDNFKVAAFKNLNPRYEKETSFWDVVDVRIDSLESGLPHEILNVFQQEFKTQDVTNWNLLSNEDKLEQLHQLKIKGKFPSDVDLEIQNAETTLVNSLRDVITNMSRLDITEDIDVPAERDIVRDEPTDQVLEEANNVSQPLLDIIVELRETMREPEPQAENMLGEAANHTDQALQFISRYENDVEQILNAPLDGVTMTRRYN